ncbi:50S ribosomal protein L15 [Kouleothrix aurantiaca]|jgi:large subunit ribosomal protein L15|uniref:Large ribosomal subunit protein uL15 n=1 Tax=Kouleothrix aurantiaca TaxID=186479 RepID=A0A0P9D714_9CHLR|nr:50S ribosomal protein L15 [Kouleothrix aurantiaca]
MKLHDLKPAEGAHRERKRVGRGPGSGKGKTAGKGMMGQKARSGPGPYRTFEGGQNRMVRRMPYLRGFKNRWRVEYQVMNVGDLSELPADHELTLEDLVASGAINKNKPLKILGEGDLNIKLTVHAHKFSNSARSKIEAAGGSVVEEPWIVETRSRSAGPNPAMRNRK